jgi:hypothetical protein
MATRLPETATYVFHPQEPDYNRQGGEVEQVAQPELVRNRNSNTSHGQQPIRVNENTLMARPRKLLEEQENECPKPAFILSTHTGQAY